VCSSTKRGAQRAILQPALCDNLAVIVGDLVGACLHVGKWFPSGQALRLEFEVDAFALDDVSREPLLVRWKRLAPEESLACGELQHAISKSSCDLVEAAGSWSSSTRLTTHRAPAGRPRPRNPDRKSLEIHELAPTDFS
jgi:hypothetical protein